MPEFYFQGKTWLDLLLSTSGDWNETFLIFNLNIERRFFHIKFPIASFWNDGGHKRVKLHLI